MLSAVELKTQTNKKMSPSRSGQPGAAVLEGGVNFSLYSRHAEEVFLLLFDAQGEEPTDIIAVERGEDNIWAVFVQGVEPGWLYGYKVKGAYNPHEGMRFNAGKLLLDPYAKAVSGDFQNTDNILSGYDAESEDKDMAPDSRDSTPCAAKSVVVDDAFDWKGISKPAVPKEQLIVYEVHVKDFTCHQSSRVSQPGTYPGFIEKIPHLKELGVNAVELLPVQQFYKSDFLSRKGLAEYWGYNTIGFFAPENSYSSKRNSCAPVEEFKTMVRELHAAGIEVILDVVYNHTGEGNQLGPTVCFRGIDNPSYYALRGTPRDGPYRYYLNDSGCGNTLNVEHPMVTQLILNSLRYWAEVMQVDGFRFDLASILARKKGQFSQNSIFFDAIARDPVLSKVKLIAEPWDLTTYQVGNFPKGWSEWNGKFRDTVRRFNKGDAGQLGDVAWRLSGSADLDGDDGRKPFNSVNFITCHDGFTLNDLYSYNQKHNQDNQENNKDGTDDNHSWNCHIEGETDKPDVLRLRKQLIKNAFCCLMFSLGTPMLMGGDEFLRTKKGNNNTYCQDNEYNWFDWAFLKKNLDIFTFCQKAICFRKKYTILHDKNFFTGKDRDGDLVPDIAWFGNDLNKPDWKKSESRCIAFQLDGSEAKSDFGNYHLFFIYNAADEVQPIKLPRHEGMPWHRMVDTSLESGKDFMEKGALLDPQGLYYAPARSVVVLWGGKI